MLGADDEFFTERPVFLAGEIHAQPLDFNSHADVQVAAVYVIHPVGIMICGCCWLYGHRIPPIPQPSRRRENSHVAFIEMIEEPLVVPLFYVTQDLTCLGRARLLFQQPCLLRDG